MSEPLVFFAAGMPQTKGSGKAITSRSTGRAFFKPDNPKTAAWQGVVAHAAAQAGAKPIDGPVRLELTFVLPRPKGHMGSGKNAATVKASAPRYPASKPDGDKLERAVLDALTGVVYADDGQVVDVTWAKRWAGVEGGGESAGVLVRAMRADGCTFVQSDSTSSRVPG